MQIRPTNTVQTTQSVTLQTRNHTEATNVSLPADQLDISAEAQMLSNTQMNSSTSGIRADRVANIRAQIADGVYDSPEKLEAAVSRMFDEFA